MSEDNYSQYNIIFIKKYTDRRSKLTFENPYPCVEVVKTRVVNRLTDSILFRRLFDYNITRLYT